VVVDADTVTQRFLRRFFEEEGYQCTVCASQAEMLSAVEGLPRPDLLLVNRGLPDGDGYDAAAALQRHYGGDPVPALLLAPAGQTPAPEVLAQHGIRSWAGKPLRRSMLRERLAAVFAPPGKPATPAAETAPPSLKIADRIPLRVLLAEDNPVNKKVALRLLERLGYRADTVADGAEVLRSIAEKPYDLSSTAWRPRAASAHSCPGDASR